MALGEKGMNDLREWVDSLGWDSSTWLIWSLCYVLVGSVVNWLAFEAYYREERPLRLVDSITIIVLWPLVTFAYLYIIIKDRKVGDKTR